MRVAWVVPRYGTEVAGGAETLCRRIADLLAADLDQTVLTSCARDYQTWADAYPPGEVRVGDVRVLRFPVAAPRDPGAFDRISAEAFARPDDVALGRRWMRAQGPDLPGLVEHLRREGPSYDAVCFVPYLYAPTHDGLPLVRDRAVLLPCAHEEPPLRLRVFDEVYAAARVLVHNTPEEGALVERRFGRDARPRHVIGLGVDAPPAVDTAAFRGRHGIEGPYLLVVGRVEPAKGVDVAIERWREVRRHRPELGLVLVGPVHMPLPSEPGLVATGFVDEEEKHAAIAGAEVVLLPSPFESLSIAALEAWRHGRPTLANAAAEPLVGQSRRSGGGLWYADAYEFHGALRLLLDHPPLARALGGQGRRWVVAEATWPRVRERWLQALGDAAGRVG